MTQHKVTLKDIETLRLSHAAPVGDLQKVIARLNLDDSGLRKIYEILADARKKRRMDDEKRMGIMDARSPKRVRRTSPSNLTEV